MLPPDLVLLSRRVVTPGAVQPAAIHVRAGRIDHIGPLESAPGGVAVIDCGGAVIMPGIVDPHVHVNEPGRTEWEGFATATRAAAAGGVTALVDMPLNSVPATTTREALRAKIKAAQDKVFVDVGFWGGVVPGNAGRLPGLLADGVLGFKAFLVPSGVEEFSHVGEADLRQALPVLAEKGAVFLVHAEAPDAIREIEGDPREYGRYLRSRPDAAEIEAIELLLRLCRDFGFRLHIVHLSSAEALPRLRKAREEGLPVTVETCPHYLTFAAEEIPDGGAAFKCSPPLRSRENREQLWEALREGLIDLIASDHSPCPLELKEIETGDFRAAWGGIASLQLALPAVWTGARQRGFTVEDLARWTGEAPARLAGLDNRKGRIAPGYDADLVVWDPEASFVVDPERLHHRHKLTPYAGRTLDGVVLRTLLRGETVYQNGAIVGSPRGRLLIEGER